MRPNKWYAYCCIIYYEATMPEVKPSVSLNVLVITACTAIGLVLSLKATGVLSVSISIRTKSVMRIFEDTESRPNCQPYILNHSGWEWYHVSTANRNKQKLSRSSWVRKWWQDNQKDNYTCTVCLCCSKSHPKRHRVWLVVHQKN